MSIELQVDVPCISPNLELLGHARGWPETSRVRQPWGPQAVTYNRPTLEPILSSRILLGSQMAFCKVRTVCLIQTTSSHCYGLICSCKLLPVCQKKPANKIGRLK